MSRLDRYLLREIGGPLGVSVVVVVLLVFLVQARRLATAALGFGLELADVAVILAAALPPFLVLAVPLAYLLSVLVGLARLGADLELVALRAAGASPLRIARMPLLLGAAVAAACLPIAHLGEPLGLALLRARLVDVGLRNLAGGILPGVFHEEFAGTALFAGDRDGSGRLLDVLLFDERHADRPLLVTARAGVVRTSATGVLADLEDGEVHPGAPPRDDTYDRLAFARARLGLDAAGRLADRTRFVNPIGELDSTTLLATARRKGPGDVFGRRLEKAYWRRFAFPSMALVFGAVGAAIGLGAGRASRARTAALGVGAVLGYYLLTRLADLAVVQLPGSAMLAAWLPNALVLGAALVALARAGRAR